MHKAMEVGGQEKKEITDTPHEHNLHAPRSTDENTLRQARSLKVIVDSSDGDKVRVNLPLNIGKMILSKSSKLSKRWSEHLDEETVEAVIDMIDRGEIGELVHVESAEGDNVLIKVE